MLSQSSQVQVLFPQMNLGNANSEEGVIYTKNVLWSTKLDVPFLETDN